MQSENVYQFYFHYENSKAAKFFKLLVTWIPEEAKKIECIPYDNSLPVMIPCLLIERSKDAILESWKDSNIFSFYVEKIIYKTLNGKMKLIEFKKAYNDVNNLREPSYLPCCFQGFNEVKEECKRPSFHYSSWSHYPILCDKHFAIVYMFPESRKNKEKLINQMFA
jgi:hypothetical protein